MNSGGAALSKAAY